MGWEVSYTDEFESWWNSLDQDEQIAVDGKVVLLQSVGPSLGRPHADVIRSSRHPNMKELIIQHAGEPYRVFYAFDSKREAIVLIGGNKTGDKRFYERVVPLADKLFDKHLRAIEKDGRKNGEEL